MALATSLELDLNKLPLIAFLAVLSLTASAETYVVVVQGLAGEQRYAEQFDEQLTTIEAAADSVTSADRTRVFRVDDARRAGVIEYLDSLKNQLTSDDQLIVYLIGHGSYDDHEYKFNLPGEDLTGEDLATALNALPNENQLVINSSSASGALADLLQNDRRMLILATRSGVERHATRFGMFFAAALEDSSADTDKNNLVTAREAFEFAQRGVSDFYERNNRLATEHPRAEGNRLERITLARLEAARPARDDSQLRELVAQRDALNEEIDELRLSRDSTSPEAYQQALLPKMLELAQLEDAIEQREAELNEQ